MRHGGKLFVVGIIAIGLVAAATAFWYHRATTRRALGFWGGEAARLIVAAPRAELLWLPEGGDLAAALEAPATLRTADLIAARGFVHARRALVEDANFDWEEPPPREAPRWDCAMRFIDDDRAVVVLVAFDPPRLRLVGGRESLAVGRVAEPLAELLRTAMGEKE